MVNSPLKTTINWEPMDLSIGGQYTEVVYAINALEKVAITPVSSEKTELIGFRSAATSKFRYRTVFKPTPTAIDTFTVAFVER